MANLTFDILNEKYISDVALSESGYNYYGFLHREGKWAIIRENTAATEYRYAVGINGTYDSSWTNRGTTTEFKKFDQL